MMIGDGFIEVDGDCDDTDAAINPDAEEVCEDGIDQDCNGADEVCPLSANEVDDDGDGYTENQGDCDDGEVAVNPDAVEICGDGIDQDCNGADEVCALGANEVDDDGDGYTENQGDCDDGEVAVNPDAVEICGDGIDQDCNGADEVCPLGTNEVDDDSDGYTENQGDCDDASALINPAAVDICGDGIDQDCSGARFASSRWIPGREMTMAMAIVRIRVIAMIPIAPFIPKPGRRVATASIRIAVARI